MPILKYNYIEPQIDNTAFIAPTASIIGKVSIGSFSSIWFNCVLRGDVNSISIGKNTNIQDGSVIHVSRQKKGQTTIGNDITVGHGAILHACTLRDGCFVGMQSLVMDGAVVSENAIVAAGSLVVSDTVIPSSEIWGGRPAKFMRKVTDYDLLFMVENIDVYKKLSTEYEK